MEVYNLRIKMKDGPKLQRGPQAAGEDSALMQRQGGNYFRAVPRHAAAPWLPFDTRPEALREARRAVATAGSVLGSPWPPGAIDAAASPPRGCCHAPGRRGGFSWGTRAAPPPRPPTGVFPLRNSKREQRRTLDPANTRLPPGRQSPGRSSRPPGPAGVRRSRRHTVTHPVWRAGWTCTRRRRGWRRWSPAAAAASPASCELSSAQAAWSSGRRAASRPAPLEQARAPRGRPAGRSESGDHSRRLPADGSMSGGLQRGEKPMPKASGRRRRSREAGGGGRERGEDGGGRPERGEGEATLLGAGLSPAPHTHHGRRRRKRRGGTPRSSGSGRPAACRGLRVSTEGRRHPCGSLTAAAKFEVYPFPPSLPPPPAVGGRWA